MRVRVDIVRRPGIADPEGATVRRALREMGFDTVTDVHFGRTIFVDVDEGDAGKAEALVQEMCERLLANPVIEDFTVSALHEAGEEAAP